MRCQYEKCKIRLNILEELIKCRCGQVFCKYHRFSLNHDCNYDYQEEQRKELRKKIISVNNKKIIKI